MSERLLNSIKVRHLEIDGSPKSKLVIQHCCLTAVCPPRPSPGADHDIFLGLAHADYAIAILLHSTFPQFCMRPKDATMILPGFFRGGVIMGERKMDWI